jgi:hypothetical protein
MLINDHDFNLLKWTTVITSSLLPSELFNLKPFKTYESRIDQTVYIYFMKTDQSSDLILTRLNPTFGSYLSIEMDGHRLLRDFVYYTYTILPLCFDQQLRMQLNYSSDRTTHVHFGTS